MKEGLSGHSSIDDIQICGWYSMGVHAWNLDEIWWMKIPSNEVFMDEVELQMTLDLWD
jgi:hypothetical protein